MILQRERFRVRSERSHVRVSVRGDDGHVEGVSDGNARQPTPAADGVRPRSSRADVEVPVGGDLIHAQRLDIPRGVQNLRRARALVQRNHLGFVPHPVVGPIQLCTRRNAVPRGGSWGAREAAANASRVSVLPPEKNETRKIETTRGSTDPEPRARVNRRFRLSKRSTESPAKSVFSRGRAAALTRRGRTTRGWRKTARRARAGHRAYLDLGVIQGRQARVGFQDEPRRRFLDPRGIQRARRGLLFRGRLRGGGRALGTPARRRNARKTARDGFSGEAR